MWDTTRQTARSLIGVAMSVVLVGCGALPLLSPSPEPVERMPGPAYVWLTSDPAEPLSPIDVAMTAPDPGILFAHTFEAGSPLRGDFFTSQGRYFLSALGGACRLPLALNPDDEAQVVLTLPGDGTCSLTIAWQGNVGAGTRPPHGEGASITNHDAGDATPRIEGGG